VNQELNSCISAVILGGMPPIALSPTEKHALLQAFPYFS
jgi:hypothetical protein